MSDVSSYDYVAFGIRDYGMMCIWDPAALYFDLGDNDMNTCAFFITF